MSITKKCIGCGKEWKEKPSHAWRKYCSLACRGIATRRSKPRVCAHCGITFETNWKTRYNKTCSTVCAHRLQAIKLKEREHNPRRYSDKAKWLAAMQSAETRKSISESNTGKVRTTPKSARHSAEHCRAVECFVRAPNNVVHYVRNITRFVHQHPELFPPGTVQWKPCNKNGSSRRCAAAHGLSVIARGYRMTWRGWMVVSNREGRERYDLIGRNMLLPPVVESAAPAIHTS